MNQSHYIVESKDRKDGEPYPIGGRFDTFDSALYYAKNCLKGNRRKYATVTRIDVIYGIPMLVNSVNTR